MEENNQDLELKNGGAITDNAHTTGGTLLEFDCATDESEPVDGPVPCKRHRFDLAPKDGQQGSESIEVQLDNKHGAGLAADQDSAQSPRPSSPPPASSQSLSGPESGDALPSAAEHKAEQSSDVSGAGSVAEKQDNSQQQDGSSGESKQKEKDLSPRSRCGRSSFKLEQSSDEVTRTEGNACLIFRGRSPPPPNLRIRSFGEVCITVRHRGERWIQAGNRVAVRRTEARAGGLVSADYVLLVLGIDEDTDAHVALLACPKGTVAGVETDCLLQLALLAIVSAEKLQDDDRMTAALALLTDGVRRVSLEKLCEDKKARRQKRKLEAFEGSDTESEAGAAVPDSGSKDCKEEQHGGQSADKTPKSSRPPRKRTRSPGSQSSHRGSGASVKTEDTVATTSGKDKRQNSGRSGTGGSGKPPAAITNSPNQDAQDDAMSTAGDDDGVPQQQHERHPRTDQEQLHQQTAMQLGDEQQTVAGLQRLEHKLGMLIDQLKTLPDTLSKLSNSAVRRPVAPRAPSTPRALVPLQQRQAPVSLARRSSDTGAENKTDRSPRAQETASQEQENLIGFSDRGMGTLDLEHIENNLLKQKIDILQDELDRKTTSAKLDKVNSQLDFIKQLKTPPRAPYYGSRWF